LGFVNDTFWCTRFERKTQDDFEGFVEIFTINGIEDKYATKDLLDLMWFLGRKRNVVLFTIVFLGKG